MIDAKKVKELREATGAGMMDCKHALEATKGDFEKAIVWLREKGISKAAKKQSRIAAEGKCIFFTKGNKTIFYELNIETDFACKNENFQKLIDSLNKALIVSSAKTTEEALKVKAGKETVESLIVNATALIGEKISLRRFGVIETKSGEVLGTYSHMNGKIISLVLLNGGNEEVARDVAMHVAAMNPNYLEEKDIDPKFLESEKQIIRNEILNEGKPANIVEKIMEGKLKKQIKEYCLVYQPFVKNADVTVGGFVEANKAKIIKFVRLGVGEGIEKREENLAEEVAKQLNA